jgi:uncharacterized membrane protein YeaQ/YmgE (transglycosylase-associated protein family)
VGVLLWIFFGTLIGIVVSFIIKSELGIVLDIAVGILGAIIGGWIMSLINKSGVTDKLERLNVRKI